MLVLRLADLADHERASSTSMLSGLALFAHSAIFSLVAKLLATIAWFRLRIHHRRSACLWLVAFLEGVSRFTAVVAEDFSIFGTINTPMTVLAAFSALVDFWSLDTNDGSHLLCKHQESQESVGIRIAEKFVAMLIVVGLRFKSFCRDVKRNAEFVSSERNEKLAGISNELGDLISAGDARSNHAEVKTLAYCIWSASEERNSKITEGFLKFVSVEAVRREAREVQILLVDREVRGLDLVYESFSEFCDKALMIAIGSGSSMVFAVVLTVFDKNDNEVLLKAKDLFENSGDEF